MKMKMKSLFLKVFLLLQTIFNVHSKINAPQEEISSSDDIQILRNLKDVYQLKMYWTRGMEWQGYSKKFEWCAECYNDDCDDGVVVIKECNDNKKDQKWIFEDDKIKPLQNPDKCVTARDDLEGYVAIRTCYDKRDKYQKFHLFDDDDEIFQIKPKENKSFCLTQNHHPREGENLKFYSCNKAEEGDTDKSDDTSRWEVGKFDGHRI